MISAEPRHNHYAPRFYLRNFACDEKRTKLPTVTKHGDRAVWQISSVEYVGAEDDLYTIDVGGMPISLERRIGRLIENPICESSTWEKIASGKAELLSMEDKPVIYALMRHLEFRTPHAKKTMDELIEMCAEKPQDFTSEERTMYRALRGDSELRAEVFARMSASLEWTWENYPLAALAIYRSPIPLRTSSVPVHAVRAPSHPALHLPLPGQIPHVATMTLNKYTFACLTLGNFGGNAFVNAEVTVDVARTYNRSRLAQFAHFEANKHLIADRADLIEDMTWAPYETELDRPDKIVFLRKELVVA